MAFLVYLLVSATLAHSVGITPSRFLAAFGRAGSHLGYLMFPWLRPTKSRRLPLGRMFML